MFLCGADGAQTRHDAAVEQRVSRLVEVGARDAATSALLPLKQLQTHTYHLVEDSSVELQKKTAFYPGRTGRISLTRVELSKV